MKIFFRLVLLWIIGGIPALSANLSVNPQDPAFLDGFNDQQKSAIYRFLSEELGDPVAAAEGSAVVNEGDLKQLHIKHLEKWRNKFGSAFTRKEKKRRKGHAILTRQKIIQDSNDLTEKLVRSFKKNESKVNCANVISITANDIGNKGYTIDKPGYYCLKAKKGILSWKPSRIADVITIDADNVILDLSDTTIIQKSNSSFASTAINILPGHKNVTIHNGSLVGFTADAVVGKSVNNLLIENMLITDNNNRDVYEPASAFASINIQSSLNTILRNITVTNTSLSSSSSNILLSAGILVADARTFLISNCRVVGAQLHANTLSQGVGISTILASNGVIENCEVSNCISDGIMPAFGYVGTQNILTKGCIANYNTGVQTTSGYYPQFSDSLQFIDCDANNNHATCQDCHGFPYFISINGFFSNCRALNNIATNSSGGFNEKTTGFEILICVNCVVENCEASNNAATNAIRHYAAGFANGNTVDVIFRNCVSIGNNAIGNFSRGVGFGPSLDPRFSGICTGTVWENCIAEGNFGDVASIGFDLFNQVGAILSNSISQNHGNNTLIPNGIGILSDGFYDEGNAVDVPCNVVPIIIITNNKENNVLVKDNTVSNNSFAGIVDTTLANNVYINNAVFHNGTNFMGPIFSLGTPIRNWTVKSAPSAANNNGVIGDNLDNLNITTP